MEKSVLSKSYVVEGYHPRTSPCIKLAAFDMDGTIIKTKSG